MSDDYHYKIAYLGIPGSYSYQAAIYYFHNSRLKLKDMKSTNSISNVFEEVLKETCGFGVVPVENSTTGSIFETFDSFLSTGLFVVGEVILKIHHNLMASKSLPLKSYRGCYSHPQAIGQCEKLFRDYPKLSKNFTDDTASAAKLISESKNDSWTAIGSKLSAEIYGLKIIKNDIEDNPNNFTRFFIIGKNENLKGNKLTLVYTLAHKPGSLVSSLKPFAQNGFNLTKIESRPMVGKPWEYLFYVDLESNNLKNEKDAIREIKEVTNFIKLIGRYDRGQIYES